MVDPCGVCAGGNTGIEPAPGDDLDGDGVADSCLAPDLEIDQDYMRETLYVDFLYVDPSDCYIEERCVSGSGIRNSSIWDEDINLGSADLAIGIPEGMPGPMPLVTTIIISRITRFTNS